MKVAVINFSTGGSVGRIAFSLFNALKKGGYDPLFCYGYREENEPLPPEHNYHIGNRLDHKFHFFMTSTFGLQGFFSICATILFLCHIKKAHINTFYLLNIHGCYLNEWLLFKYIKKHNVKTIYVMVDEYPMMGRCCFSRDCERYQIGCGKCPHLDYYPVAKYDLTHWNFELKKSCYAHLTQAIFVAPECVIFKANNSPLLKDQHLEILDEAIDVELFSPRPIEETKTKLNLPQDKIIILCVAPMDDERKGCKFFLQVACEMADNPDFLFVHVGCKPSSEYPVNYHAISYVKDQSLLADYMSCADLFVFPSLADSMPSACIDALACGTPLLCFDLPGLACLGDDTVMTLVSPKDVDALKNIILKTSTKRQDKINQCRQYALSRFDSRKYNAKLMELIQNNFDLEG